LIDVASRTGSPPAWHLFAMEVLEPSENRRSVPLSQRRFVRATDQDRHLYGLARHALKRYAKKTGSAWVPDQIIPRVDRSDNRLIDYGYVRYSDLFNARQLLHLSCLAEAIDGVEGLAREALSLAFSDHLTTTCMMTYYAFGWRRLSPLFALRAFRHVTRPVEINPWLDGTGRGTFPNTVRQVQRAAAFARSPCEPMLAGGFVSTPAFPEVSGTDQARIIHSSSANISALEDNSIDFVLTDPPYFDNIAYSELSDFYRPWLQLLGITPGGGKARLGLRENLAAKGRGENSQEPFEKLLCACFKEVSRVLKPDGRFVFTFQHHCGKAWEALAASLNEAGLRPIQVIPLLGNSRAGLHVHDGTALWDAVIVARPSTHKPDVNLRLGSDALVAAKAHCEKWSESLSQEKKANFGSADRLNLMRACLTAASLGAFGSVGRAGSARSLHEVLEEI
jgi:putative DNA methylase